MKKTLIALAVAAAVVPGFAAAADVSGFADINYTSASSVLNGPAGAKVFDNGGSTKGNQFDANTEIDVRSSVDNVTVGVDVDVSMATNVGTSSVNLEQAFFAMKATDALTVIGGIFNNPLNYEHQDVTSRVMNSQGQIAKLFDDQTALYENNVAGVAGAYNMGMATVTVAVLDALNHDTAGTNKNAQNSFAAQVALAPMDGLTVKAGMVTQNKNSSSAATSSVAVGNRNVGNVWDVNAEYKAGGLTAAVEVVGAEEVVDTAYAVYGKYAVTDAVAVGLRYDDVSYQVAGVKNTTSASINASYALAKNLAAALEYRSNDDGAKTDDSVRVKFIAKF